VNSACAIDGGKMIEPKIVQIEKEINCLGLSIRTTDKTVYKDLPHLYEKYMRLKDEGKIKNIKEPWEYVSLSNNYSGSKSWDYYTGYVVTGYEEDRNELIRFSVPAGTYAIFEIRSKSKFLFGFKMGRMKQYIYTKWLPQSGYEFTNCDYEYNNAEMHQKSPYDIDLYIGIKRKC
jgi:predicted transcriptional regulator YdeE